MTRLIRQHDLAVRSGRNRGGNVLVLVEKRRRNNVGQDHLNFFEAASEGWDQMMYNNFIAALKKRDKELLK